MICLRMFPYMGWACGCFDFPFLADARNVQVPVEHCCIRVCPHILEVVTTLMRCPTAR